METFFCEDFTNRAAQVASNRLVDTKEAFMARRIAVLSGLVVLSAGLSAGPAPARGEGGPKALATVDLSGQWTFNHDLSDNPRDKMREAGQGRGAPGGGRPPMGPRGGGGGMGGPPGGGGGRMGPATGGMGDDDDARESMRAIFEPAEDLVIAQTRSEVAIDEKFGRMRRLHPDGKKYKTDNGASELKASWKEGKLLVETRRTRGGRVIETWELVPDGSRLIVNIRIEGGFGPSVPLKRIYDRAKEGEVR
jgi:hypothetical protein